MPWALRGGLRLLREPFSVRVRHRISNRTVMAHLPKKLRVPAITKTVMTSTRILHVVAVYLAISSMFLTEPYCITSFSFRSSVYQMICSGRMTPRYRWHTGLPKCNALS